MDFGWREHGPDGVSLGVPARCHAMTASWAPIFRVTAQGQDGSQLTESVIVIEKVLGAPHGCRHRLGGFGTFSVTAGEDLLLKER